MTFLSGHSYNFYVLFENRLPHQTMIAFSRGLVTEARHSPEICSAGSLEVQPHYRPTSNLERYRLDIQFTVSANVELGDTKQAICKMIEAVATDAHLHCEHSGAHQYTMT